MNTGLHSRSRSFVSGLAAAAVTTVLVSSLVESFEPAQLLRFDDETESLRMPNGRCEFLGNDNRCRIYAVRPRQCRTYPFWPELMTPGAWRAEAARCEGIGRGGVVPLAHVRVQLRRGKG